MKTIYYNGTVYTGTLPCVTAFVVEGDKFVFAGDDTQARALAQEGDRFVDLEESFVCAGFNDSHMHLLGFGNAVQAVPLAEHTTSLEDMLASMRAFLAEHPRGEGSWLTGRGWNQDYFTDTDRMPDRHDLDKVSTEIPILATRACGHCAVVNSKALELLGLTPDTPQPEGGRIGLAEDGTLDGRFYDGALYLVNDGVPAPTKEDLKNMIRSACQILNSYGVTSSQTDDYCVFRQVPWTLVNEAYQELEQAGELTVRVYEQANFTKLDEFKKFVEAGNVTGVGSDRFKIGPLKMLGDGALGARTAFLSQPYADDPTTCGIPIFTQQEFDEMIDYANAHDMHVAVHAIGDACLDRVLNAIDKALQNHPREDHRHGIVHCQVSRPDQLQRMIDLKVHIYAQSIFLDYDIHVVEKLVGKELAASSYNWKTLMEGGLSVSNGTDCPVELPYALAGIQCAITRQNLAGDVAPYLPDQAFTVQEALDSYTIRSAEGSFEEKVKGTIAPGMLADFVVLGSDPFVTDAHVIKDIPVLATFVGGQQVYGETL